MDQKPDQRRHKFVLPDLSRLTITHTLQVGSKLVEDMRIASDSKRQSLKLPNLVKLVLKDTVCTDFPCPPIPLEGTKQYVPTYKIRGRDGPFWIGGIRSPKSLDSHNFYATSHGYGETMWSPEIDLQDILNWKARSSMYKTERTIDTSVLYHYTDLFPNPDVPLKADETMLKTFGPTWTSTAPDFVWPRSSRATIKINPEIHIYIDPQGHSMAYKCNTFDSILPGLKRKLGDGNQRTGHHNDIILPPMEFIYKGEAPVDHTLLISCIFNAVSQKGCALKYAWWWWPPNEWRDVALEDIQSTEVIINASALVVEFTYPESKRMDYVKQILRDSPTMRVVLRGDEWEKPLEGDSAPTLDLSQSSPPYEINPDNILVFYTHALKSPGPLLEVVQVFYVPESLEPLS